MLLYHRTRTSSVESIRESGFRNSTYDAFDSCGDCLGVYFCTGSAAHHPDDRGLVVVDVPDEVLGSARSVACTQAGDTDYLIDASVLKGLPTEFRIESERQP